MILDNINKELVKQGKTQKELCEFLGMSESNFSNWISGKNKSYEKKLSLIAEFLNVSEEYLITGIESEAEKFYRKFQELSKDNQDTILYIMNKEKK